MDLIAFINQQRSLNGHHEIILNLDANEALGEESQGIAKLMRECNLVDLHNIPGMELEQQLQDTYYRGDKRRINFMLGTHGYKHVYNNEAHWNTMTVSRWTIMACMSIWMQRYYLEAPPMTKSQHLHEDSPPRMRKRPKRIWMN
jgi:hypothetical protein